MCRWRRQGHGGRCWPKQRGSLPPRCGHEAACRVHPRGGGGGDGSCARAVPAAAGLGGECRRRGGWEGLIQRRHHRLGREGSGVQESELKLGRYRGSTGRLGGAQLQPSTPDMPPQVPRGAKKPSGAPVESQPARAASSFSSRLGKPSKTSSTTCCSLVTAGFRLWKWARHMDRVHSPQRGVQTTRTRPGGAQNTGRRGPRGIT